MKLIILLSSKTTDCKDLVLGEGCDENNVEEREKESEYLNEVSVIRKRWKVYNIFHFFLNKIIFRIYFYFISS